MNSKKKDLEIICNLQWKNKPRNGGERSNIIGVYDVPSTTLNWEIFKSYLLKNSGNPGIDVKVSYLASNEKEFPIQSQLDFQIALYAFRKKARNGEIINLKLESISNIDKSNKKTSRSNDVQTQFDNDEAVAGPSSPSTTDPEIAPQWFKNYMGEFKKDLLNEVSATVSSYVSTIKSHGVQSYHSRKTKNESSKRSRKHPFILCEFGNGNEKEIMKSLKLEKKVETKLEKLENKTKKLKEKKLSLLTTKSSDSDAGHSSSKSNSEKILSAVDMSLKLNAAPVRYQQSVVPHMMGGEVYLHTWEVINNGTVPWTSETELQFTWGSASLEPVEKSVPCPQLKPGESGFISVLLNVPKPAGQYESYWYFHHKGKKFGHWLGCQIIVDKVNSQEPLSNSFLNNYELLKCKYDSVFTNPKPEFERKRSLDETCSKSNVFEATTSTVRVNDSNQLSPEMPPNIAEKVKNLQLAEASDNSENTTPTFIKKQDEFIFVGPNDEPSQSRKEIEDVVLNTTPTKIQIVDNSMINQESNEQLNDFEEPNQNKLIDLNLESDNNNNTEGGQDSCSESISKIDEETSSNSTLNDMVMINFADDLDYDDIGYAYVLVDDIKVPVPKKYLRSDFLETAEEAPDPKKFIKIEANCEISSTEIIQDSIKPESSVKNENSEEKTKIEEESPQNSSNNVKESPKSTTEVNYPHLLEQANSIKESQNNPTEKIEDLSLSSFVSLDPTQDTSRIFVFPRDCPGYEVIVAEAEPAEAQMATSSVSTTTNTKDTTCNNPFEQGNVYGSNMRYPYYPYDAVYPNTAYPAYSQNVYPHPSNYSGYSYPVNYPHVPNYQQTIPQLRPKLKTEERQVESTSQYESCSAALPESTVSSVSSTPPIASVVTGAMTMASSALNTAKNVVNMIIPRADSEPIGEGEIPGSTNRTLREDNLFMLSEMGFWNRDLNDSLLDRFDDDISRVITELVG